ncbi:hypothetical protein [Pantoea ananatis]|uniref:hypothetical protein n=1 Tax=Pantoea ananas TaxID=553 RepID=UPI001B31331C|nr:hypothetical protein [Pantoea ananatis]
MSAGLFTSRENADRDCNKTRHFDDFLIHQQQELWSKALKTTQPKVRQRLIENLYPRNCILNAGYLVLIRRTLI